MCAKTRRKCGRIAARVPTLGVAQGPARVRTFVTVWRRTGPKARGRVVGGEPRARDQAP